MCDRTLKLQFPLVLFIFRDRSNLVYNNLQPEPYNDSLQFGTTLFYTYIPRHMVMIFTGCGKIASQRRHFSLAFSVRYQIG